jgi:peptide/nickel transport system ATP-binding protein
MTEALSPDVPLLECKDLSISYFTRAGEIPAVIDFNLTVHPGEAVGLVGESGCGKTTVAMAIVRYLGGNGRIVSGGITYRGRDLLSLGAEELRRLRGNEIATIYQEPMASLNPSMTIGRQLMEVPLYHDNASKRQARDKAIEILDAVHLPDPARIMAAYPHQISGGQQQRVIIAMALLANPQLLLLDEPTTALDVTVEAGIIELVAEIGEKFGTGMLYISHNLGLIRETCDRIVVMYSGEAVESGTIDQVFDEPRHPYTHGLFNCIALPTTDKNARPLVPIRGQLPLPHERPKGCNFGPRCDFFQAGRCDEGFIHMRETDVPGQTARCLRWNEIDWAEHEPERVQNIPTEVGEEVLRIDSLRKYYEVHDRSLSALISGKAVRHVKANEDLSFVAHEGETIAIVGESGCGKSTFAKVLMGLETATSGTLDFEGDDISKTEVGDRSAKQIGALQMVFQNPFDTLNPSQTIGSQIVRVLRRFGQADSKGEAQSMMLKLLDTVKLPRDFARRRPRQLSGGQKQRVGIARAFAGKPATVIADEPVSALDVSVAAAVTELLLDIQRRNNSTLLFISHDLSIVRYLADRVIVMYLGQIIEQGTTDEIFNPPYNPYTEALLSAVPVADTNVEKRRIILEGNVPSPLDPPAGCPFSTRCQHRLGEICGTIPPPRQETESGHSILCHIPLDELAKAEPVFSFKDTPQAAE